MPLKLACVVVILSSPVGLWPPALAQTAPQKPVVATQGEALPVSAKLSIVQPLAEDLKGRPIRYTVTCGQTFTLVVSLDSTPAFRNSQKALRLVLPASIKTKGRVSTSWQGTAATHTLRQELRLSAPAEQEISAIASLPKSQFVSETKILVTCQPAKGQTARTQLEAL